MNARERAFWWSEEKAWQRERERERKRERRRRKRKRESKREQKREIERGERERGERERGERIERERGERERGERERKREEGKEGGMERRKEEAGTSAVFPGMRPRELSRCANSEEEIRGVVDPSKCSLRTFFEEQSECGSTHIRGYDFAICVLPQMLLLCTSPNCVA
jgi:hypothetical protein